MIFLRYILLAPFFFLALSAGSAEPFGDSIQTARGMGTSSTGFFGVDKRRNSISRSKQRNVRAAIRRQYYCEDLLSTISLSAWARSKGPIERIQDLPQEPQLLIHEKYGPIYFKGLGPEAGEVKVLIPQIYQAVINASQYTGRAPVSNPKYSVATMTMNFDRLRAEGSMALANSSEGNSLVRRRAETLGLTLDSVAVAFIEGEIRARMRENKGFKPLPSLELWQSPNLDSNPEIRAQQIYTLTGDHLLRSAVLRSFTRSDLVISNFMAIEGGGKQSLSFMATIPADIQHLFVRELWDRWKAQGLKADFDFSLGTYKKAGTDPTHAFSQGLQTFRTDSSEEAFNALVDLAGPGRHQEMAEFFKKLSDLKESGVEVTVCPIPSHSSEHALRELTEFISSRYNFRLDWRLFQSKAVGKQVAEETFWGRLDNYGSVQEPFQIDKRRAQGGVYLLVDDIYTTGITLTAAKRQLYALPETKAVYTFTLGRTN